MTEAEGGGERLAKRLAHELPCSRSEAERAAPTVQAAFAAAGFDSQAWVSPINAVGAELLSAN